MTKTYDVYRDGTRLASGLIVPSYVDTGLVNGVPHIYRVSAVVNGVEGLQSAPISATPVAGLTPSGVIVVTTNGVTIDSKSFSGPIGVNGPPPGTGDLDHPGTEVAIYAAGSSGSPIDHLTIRNCTFKGFNIAIELQHVTNVTLEDITINDVWYAGIEVRSGVGGTINRCTIQRVGPQTQAAISAASGGFANEIDAYGIVLERVATSDFTANPRSANWVISNSLVTDIPVWHGIDTHAGQNIDIESCTVSRVMRAMFITADGLGNGPIDVTINNCHLLEAKSWSVGDGGAPQGNLDAITTVNLTGGAFTNNTVSRSYGSSDPNYYRDFGGASTGITESGNVSVA